MAKRVGGDVVETYKSKVNEVLSGCSVREVGKAKLYFVNQELMDKLIALQKEYDQRDTFSKRVRTEFSKVINLINLESPTDWYAVGMRGRHRQISSEETVLLQLESEFAIWKNTMIKNAKETITLHSLSGEMETKIFTDLNNQINLAHEELLFIKNNFDKLVVKIAGYRHEITYPYIQYSIDVKGKRKTANKHLSILAPNVLNYAPAVFRIDMKIDEFIKKARNPFGDIFYLKKQEE